MLMHGSNHHYFTLHGKHELLHQTWIISYVDTCIGNGQACKVTCSLVGLFIINAYINYVITDSKSGCMHVFVMSSSKKSNHFCHSTCTCMHATNLYTPINLIPRLGNISLDPSIPCCVSMLHAEK